MLGSVAVMTEFYKGITKSKRACGSGLKFE